MANGLFSSRSKSLRSGLRDEARAVEDQITELREEIAQCVDMVRTGRKPIATGRDGLWSAGLCLVAEESIRQGKPLPVGELVSV